VVNEADAETVRLIYSALSGAGLCSVTGREPASLAHVVPHWWTER
jgi:hypothetical protein